MSNVGLNSGSRIAASGQGRSIEEMASMGNQLAEQFGKLNEAAAAASGERVHAGFDLNRDVRVARRLRHLRKTVFGPDLYSGPAWDILLYLFESSVLQRRYTIGKVTTSTDLAGTTALRWIGRLQQQQLIHVRDDHLDGRRRYVELSQSCIDLMNRYFSGAAPHRVAA
jgi:hypothetical protein